MPWLDRHFLAEAIARQCAGHLLLEFLTPEQRRDYRRYGLFIVKSQFGRHYQVGRLGVRRLRWGSRARWRPAVASYCLVPAVTGAIPDADLILATALWLAYDERRFLRTAVCKRVESASALESLAFAVSCLLARLCT
jgi:hypothetical protein